MDMGEKIKQLRRSLGYTLEDVGNIVGVGKSTVRKWENGDIANMRRDKIANLAKALETTPAYLMGWEEPQQKTPQKKGVNEKEQRLVDDFRAMNTEGQDRLVNYADDLIVSGKYNKSDSIQKDA